MSELHAGTVAYVRDTMIPPAPPPRGEGGALNWLRDNLFPSWLNAILTVVAVAAVVWVVAHVAPWMWRGIWHAGSLTECRAIRDELYGPGVSAACFAVLTDRWHQLVFGFYPQTQYWRPILSLVILLAALAPVLFSRVPRVFFVFTAIAPFAIFWLLWGGSIWGPVWIAASFLLGAAVLSDLSSANRIVAAVLALAAVLGFWLFLAGPLTGVMTRTLPLALPSVETREFGGFLLSFIIGVSGMALSFPLGILLALGRRSDLPLIKAISVGFIELIRGVPLIVWLFTASLLLNYFLPPGTTFDLMLRVIIMVTLFAAAYIAEVIRGGLAALPRGQYEAGDSLGLDYWLSMRLIILPQALKISIPGLVNTFISMLKDTTLVMFIGLLDPIGLSNSIRADTDWNGVYWELFLFIGLMFFIVCFGMSRYSQYLERKLRRDYR